MISKESLVSEFKNELTKVLDNWKGVKADGKWGILSKGIDIQRVLSIKEFLQKFGISEEELGVTENELLELMK